MMESSSPGSKPKRGGQDPEPNHTRKKKARGRPLKNSGSSNVPEERRAQIRRAQEAFRLRKEAATKSLEDKVLSLQACVKDMSETFLDLSDSMIRSDILHQDSAIGQNLVAATSKFIILAKSAADDSEGAADATSEKRIRASDQERALPQTQASTRLNSRQPSSTIPARRITVSDDFNPVPETLLKKKVFGNGWFGLQPEVLSKLSPTKADMGRLDSSFGMKLLQTTLSIAYDYLIDSTGAYHDTIHDIYAFALIYHSREELLFNIRWFLGPGLCTLRALGRAVFGFSSSLSLQYLNAISSGIEPKILNPLVDALALVEAQKKFPISQYLNAFDVEDYIISKGAFHIDQDVIYLRMSDEDHLSRTWSGTPTQHYGFNASAFPDRIFSSEPASTENTTSSLDVTSNSIPAEQPSSDTWGGILNFNGMHDEDYGANSSEINSIQTSPVKNAIRTLSVPVLLQSLAKRATCLGTGPGYPTRSIDIAIELSTVDYSP